jgi:ribosomal protein L39E
MASNKTSGKKKRLGHAAKQTHWAPIWVIPKALGKGKKVHPSAINPDKRHWRRGSKLKV